MQNEEVVAVVLVSKGILLEEFSISPLKKIILFCLTVKTMKLLAFLRALMEVRQQVPVEVSMLLHMEEMEAAPVCIKKIA